MSSLLRRQPHTVRLKRPAVTRDADNNVGTLDYASPTRNVLVKCLFQTRGGTIVSTDEGGLIPFDAMLYTGETNIEVNDRVEVAISFFTGNFKVVGVQPKGKLRGRYTHNEVVLQKDGVR